MQGHHLDSTHFGYIRRLRIISPRPRRPNLFRIPTHGRFQMSNRRLKIPSFLPLFNNLDFISAGSRYTLSFLDFNNLFDESATRCESHDGPFGVFFVEVFKGGGVVGSWGGGFGMVGEAGVGVGDGGTTVLGEGGGGEGGGGVVGWGLLDWAFGGFTGNEFSALMIISEKCEM